MDHSSQPTENQLSKKAMQVLDAAKRLFIDQGFGNTSMDAIAARADVSKATVYAHYNSKEALFAAMTRRECQRVTAQMAIPRDVADLPPAAALERIARSFLWAGFSDEIMALLQTVIAETPRFPELGQIFYRSAPGLTLQGVIDYMERARSHGLLTIDDCELAAGQFLGMLRGDRHMRALLGQPCERGRLDLLAREAVATFMARYKPVQSRSAQ